MQAPRRCRTSLPAPPPRDVTRLFGMSDIPRPFRPVASQPAVVCFWETGFSAADHLGNPIDPKAAGSAPVYKSGPYWLGAEHWYIPDLPGGSWAPARARAGACARTQAWAGTTGARGTSGRERWRATSRSRRPFGRWAHPLPHLRQDCARGAHICTGTGLAFATPSPGLGLTAATSTPGLGLSPATSAPGLDSPLPHRNYTKTPAFFLQAEINEDPDAQPATIVSPFRTVHPCVCLCLCVSVCLCVCVPICINAYVCEYLCIYVCEMACGVSAACCTPPVACCIMTGRAPFEVGMDAALPLRE